MMGTIGSSLRTPERSLSGAPAGATPSEPARCFELYMPLPDLVNRRPFAAGSQT